MKIQIDRVILVREEIDFPELCPGCGADFTDYSDIVLTRSDLIVERGGALLVRHKDKAITSFDDGGDGKEYGDTIAAPYHFECSRCPWKWEHKNVPKPIAMLREALTIRKDGVPGIFRRIKNALVLLGFDTDAKENGT